MQSGVETFTGLRHFVGVVEDRNDPEKIGRVKVRIYSIHTEDKTAIPTEELPWAMVLNGTNSASLSGIGHSPTGMVEGTWVFGVFLDTEFQDPLVLGTIVGKPSEAAQDKGFFDHKNKTYPLNDTELSELGESSINRHAREDEAEDHLTLKSKRNSKIKKVETSKAFEIPSVQANKKDSLYQRVEWKEPHPRYGGQGDQQPSGPQSTYPLNHVWYTEAGHLFEVDDTPGAERIHMYHKQGTFQEIQADGSRVTKVQGNDYEMFLKDKDILIKGDCNVTIEGNCRMLVKEDLIQEVDGDYFLSVRGDYIKKVQGNESKEILSDKATQINGNKSERVSKNVTITTVGNFIDSIKGLFTKTVTGEEKRTNLAQATHILPDNFTLLGANNLNIAAGGNLNIAAEGTMKLKSIGNQTVESEATQTITAPTMDIDAETGTIDYNSGSIDVVSGNITDTNVTLHTHTHKTTSMDTGNGANSGKKNDSDSPTSGT